MTKDKTLAYTIALHAAIRGRDRAGVDALLKIGADVNWKDAAGETALFKCARFDGRGGREDMTVDLILALDECELDERNKAGLRAVDQADNCERPSTARLICDEYIRRWGQGPLMP